MLRGVSLSIGLALATSLTVGLLEAYLPFSAAKNRVIDGISLPGALIAGVFYPEGIHTGSGAPGFVYAAVAANFLFYAAVWYGVLTLAQIVGGRRRSERHEGV